MSENVHDFRTIPVVSVRLVRERDLEYRLDHTINSPNAAIEVMSQFFEGADREMFVILLLDTQNKVNGLHLVSVGALNECLVAPREVFKAAILANAKSIILGHCHTSGDPEPSREDFEITRQLRLAGEFLGIPVVDHIVVGDQRYYSFKDHGWL